MCVCHRLLYTFIYLLFTIYITNFIFHNTNYKVLIFKIYIWSLVSSFIELYSIQILSYLHY